MNTKQWKDKTLNSLLMERFGYSVPQPTCEETHPGKTHEQHLQENDLEEGHCTPNRDELEESGFTLAADAASDAGKKEFEFPEGSGEMYPVTIKADIPN